MSTVTLYENPKELTYLWQSASVCLRAFSDSSYFRFLGKTPEDAITDPIDPARHEYQYKEYIHRRLHPRKLLVCAVKDTKVVGYAWWSLPVSLAREETLYEKIYRMSVDTKEKFRDYLFPPKWLHRGRCKVYAKAKEACEEIFLGSNEVDKEWYLVALAVDPDYQRQGIGQMLVSYGLDLVQKRGEKVYLIATVPGEGLYTKMGFKKLGNLDARLGEASNTEAFMVWEGKSE
jgi:ribosomal protein S18 acetylase RimI-like enzyme